jgi:hypothetical protein
MVKARIIFVGRGVANDVKRDKYKLFNLFHQLLTLFSLDVFTVHRGRMLGIFNVSN